MSTMAEAVNNEVPGHVIDIYVDGKEKMSIDQSSKLQEKLNYALFQEEDISKLKFNEPPHFDGTRLRLICHKDETKSWVE